MFAIVLILTLLCSCSYIRCCVCCLHGARGAGRQDHFFLVPCITYRACTMCDTMCLAPCTIYHVPCTAYIPCTVYHVRFDRFSFCRCWKDEAADAIPGGLQTAVVLLVAAVADVLPCRVPEFAKLIYYDQTPYIPNTGTIIKYQVGCLRRIWLGWVSCSLFPI